MCETPPGCTPSNILRSPQFTAPTSVDARGSWYFRVVELLDIVRVELELQQSNPEAALPTGARPVRKAGCDSNSDGYQQDKDHSVWHSSGLPLVPISLHSHHIFSPSRQLWAWPSRTRVGLSDQVQPHLPSPTSSTTCNRADAQSSALTGITGSMTLCSLHLASRQLVLDLASARDLLQRRRSAASPGSVTIRSLTVSI